MKGSREGKGCGSRGKVVSKSPETDAWMDSPVAVVYTAGAG